MNDKLRKITLFFCLSCITIIFSFTLSLATGQSNEITVHNKDDRREWDLKDVDIHTVIDQVSKETGKNFIISPQVTGKVTFISSSPITTDELYQAFLALLETSGFIAIPSDTSVKILPETYAKEESSRFYDPNQRTREMAVTVLKIKYISAPELVKVLKQLVFRFGYIEAYVPTNDIIIADKSSNIARIVNLIQRLDKPSATNFEVVHLKYAQSPELVKMVNGLLQRKGGEASAVMMVADDRSNYVLLHGGTPEQHLQIRSLIAELDVPVNRKSVHTVVIGLKYLNAKKMAVILNSLIQNYIQEKGEKALLGQAPAGGGGDSDEKKPELVNYADQLKSLNTTSQTGGAVAGADSSTPVDFSTMKEKQPSSGSVSNYVQWEEATNSVIVSAPTELLVKLRKVVKQLDVRRRQILIEAVIAEVEAGRANELGIEINTGGKVKFLTRFPSNLPVSTIGSNGQIAISNPLTPDAIGQGLTSAYYKLNNLRILLRALQNDTRSNILSTPNIVTLDNEPAQIKVGQKISFSIGQIQNNPTGGNPFNFFNMQDVGLKLTINPQITSDGTIRLIIEQELSNLLPGQTSAGGNPNLSERFIHTTVMAKDGDVLILGGLIQSEWQDVNSKVPVLGDIPGVGVFFRSTQKQLVKQNLMVFLRPTILKDDNTEKVVGSKYEKMRQEELETERHPNLQNNLSSPVMPVWGGEAILPT